ncbi:MAG: FMN-binding protein [Clostridia bacterium]|nr:FMN-binding protein [Clostridia bacterium]
MKIFKNQILKLCVSLFVITAVVSLALAGVNALTKDRIAALEGEAEFNTIRQFYDYDAVFEKLALGDGTEYFAAYKPANAEGETPAPQEPASDAAEQSSEESSETPASSEESSEASSEESSASPETPSEPETPAQDNASGEKGELLGYAVTVSENGYGGEIKMLVCFDKFGQVNGMGVISMSETNGVGTRITGEGFFDQFTGKSAPFKFVKGTPSGKNDIAAITGASISSKAAVGAVNKAFVLLSDLFIEG